MGAVLGQLFGRNAVRCIGQQPCVQQTRKVRGAFVAEEIGEDKQAAGFQTKNAVPAVTLL